MTKALRQEKGVKRMFFYLLVVTFFILLNLSQVSLSEAGSTVPVPDMPYNYLSNPTPAIGTWPTPEKPLFRFLMLVLPIIR